jgi:hypothetical protein
MCFLSRSRVLNYRHRKGSPTCQQGGGLHNPETVPASAESFALPATIVPHRERNLPDPVLEDAKALRDIFGPPSSIRSHEAARGVLGHGLTSKCSNSEIDLAGQTPTRSANSRLEAFGQVVKRLSGSRLSRESLKTMVTDRSSQDSPEIRGRVSPSYRSTGLTDLLMSRTASDDGYDSDAKAISTLRLRKSSNHGSSKTGSEYSIEILRSQNNALPEKTSPTASIPEQKPDLVEVTAESQGIDGEDAFYDTALARADVQEEVMAEGNKSNCSGIVQQGESRKMVYSASLSLSDTNSIHLADMYMSQRLAPTSVMPLTSLSSTIFRSNTEHDAETYLPPDIIQMAGPQLQRHSANNGLPWHLQGQPSVVGRYPGFIAQEHNRKPSDPRTRELFEDRTGGSRLHLKRNSVTRTSSMLNNPKQEDLIKEGASPQHMVKGELLVHGTYSPATAPMNIVHSGAIKNLNSLAVPGRSAAANMGQRQARIGQCSNAEGCSWLGDSKHKKQHSLRGSNDALAPHKKGSEGAPVICIHGSTSRESRFSEEAMHYQSAAARTALSTAGVSKGMSEVSEGAVQEKRHEEMSETAPDLQVSKARSRHSSDETWSTSEGWLTQGRRSGFGYKFIERSHSCDSQLSRGHQDVEDPAGETAAVFWDRASKTVREGGPIESSSKPRLSLPFRSNSVGKKASKSSFNSHPRRSKPVASEWKVAPKDPTSEHLDPLETTEAQKPLSRLSAQWNFRTGNDESSQATLTEDGHRKKSLFDIRRYTIDGVKESRAASAVVVRDFPSWAKFPSHTRKERCDPASEKDGIQARDFSPPSPDLKASRFQSNFSSQDHRSASNREANGPGSWRKRAFGRTRKSKSLDEFRLSEGISDNRVDSREEVWCPSSTIPTGHGTESCSPAEEAKGLSPQNAMQKGNFPSEFDGSVSSKIPEDHVGSTGKSDSDSSSAQQRDGDGNYDSLLEATVSNGVGNGSGDFGVETNKFRLASTELWDSTVDFRAALMEREQSRDDSLKSTQGLDESGDEGRDEDEEQKNKEKNDAALESS